MSIYGEQTGGFTAVAALLALGAIACVFRPPPARYAFGFLVAGALALRGSGIDQWVIHPGTRDMLPLIVSACETLLTGENPYRLYAMQIGSEVPLTYPPLLWLAYLPAVAAGFDPRWTNWLCDAVVATAIAWPLLVAERDASQTVPRETPHAAALVLVAAYLFSPDVHWNGVYAESHVDWAMLAVLARALSMPTWPSALGVLYGLALLTRPFNVMLLPLLVVFLWRRDGVRSAARTLALSGLVAAIGYLPFVLADPEMFYFGTVHWLLDFGPAHAEWFREMIGLAGWLYAHDHEHLMPVAQLVAVTFGTCACLLWADSNRRFIAIVMMTYAAFVAFNSLIWMSFWVSVGLWAAIAATAPQFRTNPPHRRGFSTADGPLVFAVGSVLSAGALLLVLLAGTMRDRGEQEAVRQANAAAGEGAFWVDWRDYRGALPNDENAAGGTRSLWTTQQGANARQPVDWTAMSGVTVVDRYGAIHREPWLRDAVTGHSRFLIVERDEEVGDYRVLQLKRRVAERVAQWSDASAFRALRVARETHGGQSIDAELVGEDDPPASTRAAPQDGAARHVFPGLPQWTAVQQQDCVIEGADHPLLSAHPLDDKVLVLRAIVPPEASVALITAGLRDGVVEWHRADVWIDVHTTGTDRRLHVPNRRGMRALDVAVQPGEPIELRVTTTDDGRRDLCVNVEFWR